MRPLARQGGTFREHRGRRDPGHLPRGRRKHRLRRTRKHPAQIHRLQNGAGINLMIFDRTIRVWEKSLKILTRSVRKKALAYAKGLTTGGGTNIFDTVERALKDPLVDTIYLLTDGAATTGRFKDADGRLNGIREFNRTRGITIHCIAFGREVEWRRKCAEQNGGKYRYVAE